ncbi:MAG: zinc ribbon domain-containing protein [Candidatus Thorarchaeota archaeon]|nr:zinc ribbon domain-containing protein [Candidatus Thorarchaeota archaeon]
MELKFILLAAILVLSVISVSAEPAEALPFDYEITNQALDTDEWYYVWDSFNIGDVISGYFETHSAIQGLYSFFICDETNYNVWDTGGTADVYNLESNMHTLAFSFTVTSTDTWYVVFSNYGGSQAITLDLGIDGNDDNTPRYSSSIYEYTAYGEVIENDEWFYAYGTYTAGTEFSGHFSTFFDTDGVTFFICDETNFDIWESGGTADVYGLKSDYHQANIDSFTAPTTGVWYFVFSALDEADTVTISVGIEIDTSGSTTGTEPPSEWLDMTNLSAIGATALIVVCVVCSKRKGRPSTQGPTYVTRPPAPGSGTNKEMVLGALKAYPRVSMSELESILHIPENEVRRLTLMFIASGEIQGTFNKGTDEFTSIHASKVGSELRRDAKDELDIQRCPNCGAPISGHFVVGDNVECKSCGVKFNV